LELAMGEPLHEMILHGGEFVSIPKIEEEISRLEAERVEWNERGSEIAVASGGKPLNLGSPRQLAQHLREIDQFELELSAKGNFLVRKSDLLSFTSNEPKHEKTVAGCAYEYRDITKVIGYFRSYLRAARHEVEWREQRSNRDFCTRTNRNIRNGNSTRSIRKSGSRCSDQNGESDKSSYSPTGERIGELIKIPKSYSLSAAKTR